MIEAVKSTRRFLQSTPFNDYVVNQFGLVGGAETDEEILAAAFESVVTFFHPVATARMSPDTANWGVLDSQLRVKGAHGLRVVDASAIVSLSITHAIAPI